MKHGAGDGVAERDVIEDIGAAGVLGGAATNQDAVPGHGRGGEADGDTPCGPAISMPVPESVRLAPANETAPPVVFCTKMARPALFAMEPL